MRRALPATLLLFLACPVHSEAAEISHYNPGAPYMRDFFVPQEGGFYVSSYNFYYQTGRLNDHNGHETNQVIYDPRNGNFPEIDPDIDVVATAIPITWVKKSVFGGEGRLGEIDYGVTVALVGANSSIADSLAAETQQGSDPVTSQFGLGDLFVQPLWLGAKESDKFTWAVSWGFYAPTGKYDTEPATHPVYGPIRVPSISNIGSGFWTNQFRGALLWTPKPYRPGDEARGWRGFPLPSLSLAATYEINSEKDDLHVTPGQHLSLNWGIEEILPLGKTQWLVQFGPVGYHSWQVTSDEGRGRENDLLDQVHAAGFQVSLIDYPCQSVVNFHYYNEYASESRFQGHVIGLSFTAHFAADKPGAAPVERCSCPWL